MRQREQLIDAVRDRIRRFRDQQDRDCLLTRRARRDAAKLAAAIDPDSDLNAAFVLGIFHWCRHSVLPDGAGKKDLEAAVRFFVPVHRSRPELVPPQLHRLCEEQTGHEAAVARGAVDLFSAYARTGDLTVLRKAVAVGRTAMTVLHEDNPYRAVILPVLAVRLRELYQLTRDPTILPGAVDLARAALAATPEGDQNRPMLLANLAAALQEMSEHTGDITALSEVRTLLRTAVAAIPAGDPGRAVPLSALARALQNLAKQNRNTTPLLEAVELARAALAATADAAWRRYDLGSILLDLFERTGDTAALDEATTHLRAAVATASEDRLVPASQDVLARTRYRQFERTGDVEALRESVALFRAAVTALPDGDPARAAYLVGLGTALKDLGGSTGDTRLLAESAARLRAAVGTAREGPERTRCRAALGSALLAEFEHTGDSDLLNESITHLRASIGAATDDEERVIVLEGLARATYRQFERTRDPDLLEETITHLRAAIDAAPDDHLRPALLVNLSSALRELPESDGLLPESIALLRTAVDATPEDDPDRVRQLTNLAAALRTLSERTGDTGPLAEALEVSRTAAAATREDHPQHTVILTNLGTVLVEMSKHTRRSELEAQAIQCFRQAAGNTSAPAPQRIEAYLRLTAIAAYLEQEPAAALAAVEAAVGLLPQVATRALARPDREHHLGQLVELPGRAAAAAVNAGDPERAVELLEQSRGVLVADVLDARSSELTRLRENSPDLAEELLAARARLDALDSRSAGPGLTEARRGAQADWERVRERVGEFPRAPDFAHLAAQAEHGSIVLLYADSTRCDALVLQAGRPVRVVPLTRFTERDAIDCAARLHRARHTAADPQVGRDRRGGAQREISGVLAWLWDAVTEPVLKAVGHTETPPDGESWPRIWWCPVGVLAYLPLHAAGRHATRGDDPPTVLDRAVSSYIPTIRGLAHARTHRPEPAARTTTIVAVPDAPGVAPLPGAAGEAEDLAALIPGARVLPHPTRQNVLDALPDAFVAHFACHAHTGRDDPAAGQLILHDHRTAPLTVADIGALRLTGGLAVLAACDTARTSPSLTNEAVHLTGAFHLAGYQHVVGSLWSVGDRASRLLLTDFFGDLTRGGTTAPEVDRSACALHHATRRLRAGHRFAPTFWAGYTHTGT